MHSPSLPLSLLTIVWKWSESHKVQQIKSMMKKEGGKGSELLYYLHNLWGEIEMHRWGEYIIFGGKGHSFGFGLGCCCFLHLLAHERRIHPQHLSEYEKSTNCQKSIGSKKKRIFP
jgi:hypothetical protein